jgi:hypothetical protein
VRLENPAIMLDAVIHCIDKTSNAYLFIILLLRPSSKGKIIITRLRLFILVITLMESAEPEKRWSGKESRGLKVKD